ncbi:ACP S-malonyltransferase [Nocardia nova]|uniref:ACP S-malonyltransferase n=1 Tax=Nocardia nova TaxID=37330 RepID=UPI0033C89B4D
MSEAGPVPEFRTVALFPGQGAYLTETFLHYADRWPQIADTFQEIDDGTAELAIDPISPRLLNGSPPELRELLAEDPDTLQLALFGTAVAAHRIVLAQRIRVQALAGHSFGEIAALVAGGALTVGRGARIVHLRSRCLESSTESGGMLALRARPERARALVAAIDIENLVVAVENGPRQTVLAGPSEALTTAESVAREIGVTAVRVASPYPFHSPLLVAAAARFRQRLRPELTGAVRSPRVPVYSPILRRFYTGDDDFAEILADHLVRPVWFTAALRHLESTGARRFIECGARDALTGIVRRTLPTASAVPTIVAGTRAVSAAVPAY